MASDTNGGPTVGLVLNQHQKMVTAPKKTMWKCVEVCGSYFRYLPQGIETTVLQWLPEHEGVSSASNLGICLEREAAARPPPNSFDRFSANKHRSQNNLLPDKSSFSGFRETKNNSPPPPPPPPCLRLDTTRLPRPLVSLPRGPVHRSAGALHPQRPHQDPGLAHDPGEGLLLGKLPELLARLSGPPKMGWEIPFGFPSNQPKKGYPHKQTQRKCLIKIGGMYNVS